MRNLLLTTTLLLTFQNVYSQGKYISITIDDVPNTSKFETDGFRSIFLERLDSMNIPFTIFVNENKLYKTDSIQKNKLLLERWIRHRNSLIGNHSYSHLRYSKVGYNIFTNDIQKGALLSKEYTSKVSKELIYFRFPFNDLGKDSIEQTQIQSYLISEGYHIAPFTIESSDWMFNYVYQYYLNQNDLEKAKSIGEAYVNKTIELIEFFEKMAYSIYGRKIKQTYLCHDNAINTDYLHLIVDTLQRDGYVIESFKNSLKDSVYSQKDNYYQKWGISWLYRWLNSQEERSKWMKQEPDISEIKKHYNLVQNKKKN